SWQLHFGEIPDGMVVCHTCDNPSCVNPHHLFLGTPADNNQDRTRKGRTVAPVGEEHGLSKLTEKQVLEIRELANEGMTKAAIARQYGVDRGTIYHIVNRITWRHL